MYAKTLGNGEVLKIELGSLYIGGRKISTNFTKAPKNDKGIVAVADGKYGLKKEDIAALNESRKELADVPMSSKEKELKKYYDDKEKIEKLMNRGWV